MKETKQYRAICRHGGLVSAVHQRELSFIHPEELCDIGKLQSISLSPGFPVCSVDSGSAWQCEREVGSQRGEDKEKSWDKQIC